MAKLMKAMKAAKNAEEADTSSPEVKPMKAMKAAKTPVAKAAKAPIATMKVIKAMKEKTKKKEAKEQAAVEDILKKMAKATSPKKAPRVEKAKEVKTSPKKARVWKEAKSTKRELKTPKKSDTEKKHVQEVTTPQPDKPKKPVAGAYGIFLQERREEIVKSLPTGHKVTDVTKKAAEQYKALSEDERKVLVEKYNEKSETYKAAVEEYKKAMTAGGHSLETPSKKRKLNHGTPTKAHYNPVKVAAESLGPIDSEALREAFGLGYDQAFRSLASCALLIEKKVPHTKIVRALRASGGLEKKAFAALKNY